jgi:MFS family permease
MEEVAQRRLEEAVVSASSVPADPECVRVRIYFLVVFAAVYGLADADTTTIGTAATQLRHALSLSNFQLGSLVAVGTAVGALTTLPAGILADRIKRVQLLAWSVLLWALAMGASALASSYPTLLVTRVFLGGVLAVNGPITASLLGDLWPAPDRGRIYGFITSGELFGAGVGFFISGELAAISWRLSFAVLAVPAAVLAWKIWKLPEPERTVRRLGPEPTSSVATFPDAPIAAGVAAQDPRLAEDDAASVNGPAARGAATGDLAGAGAPGREHFWRVIGYVFSIPTNVILVVAGSLTWVFLSAVESFGEEFAKEQYGLSQVLATIVLLVVGVGAVLGAAAAGQAGDALVRAGRRAGRLSVAALATLMATAVFVPALLTGNVAVALPLLIIAAFGLAAANPPIDATRIEVVRSSVWGRAEAVRSLIRTGFQAAAPLLVGFLADSLGGGGHRGIQLAFLSMLALLLVAGLLLLAGYRTYPGDRLRAIEADRASALTPWPPDGAGGSGGARDGAVPAGSGAGGDARAKASG